MTAKRIEWNRNEHLCSIVHVCAERGLRCFTIIVVHPHRFDILRLCFMYSHRMTSAHDENGKGATGDRMRISHITSVKNTSALGSNEYAFGDDGAMRYAHIGQCAQNIRVDRVSYRKCTSLERAVILAYWNYVYKSVVMFVPCIASISRGRKYCVLVATTFLPFYATERYGL